MPCLFRVATLIVAAILTGCASRRPAESSSSHGNAARTSVPAADRQAEDAADAYRTEVTVVRMADGDDVVHAAEKIVESLRRAGYRVNVEAPEQVIGTWLGTYISSESEGSCTPACVDAIHAIVSGAGFNPGRDEVRLPRCPASPSTLCRCAVNVGINPREKGQFILY